MRLLFRLLINTIAVLVASYILPGVEVVDITTAFIVAIVLGLLNSVLRPILLILTLPINILTLGLFTFVINFLMISLTSYLVPGFIVSGFISAMLFSLVTSLVSSFLSNISN